LRKLTQRISCLVGAGNQMLNGNASCPYGQRRAIGVPMPTIKHPCIKRVKKLNAGGIPQILGLNPKISVEEQINRGFTYIESRYSDPCSAWRFWERNNWY
jgi:hypothetical protein